MGEGCINLQERFGKRYRVGYEESYQAQYGKRSRRCDPWLMVIHCRYGHIYPFGGDLLAASVDGHAQIANRLRRLSCCRDYQDGDGGELTALFNVADLPEVAKILRPRRRRQLSDQQKKELTERLLASRRSGRFTGNESQKTDHR